MSNVIYTVKKGDTLSKIALKYGTTVNKLVKDNGIVNANLIRVGQVLNIETEDEAPKQPDKNEVAEALKTCLSDVEKLDSFKKVIKLLG